MLLIGLTGTIGAGKGTLVEHLTARYGFVHYSARDFILEEVRRRGLAENRDSLTLVGNDLRASHHPGYIIECLVRQAQAVGRDAVVESIRTLGEVGVLRSAGKAYLVAVDAKRPVRYGRVRERGTVTDGVSWEKFVADEEREMSSQDPHAQNLGACIAAADVVVRNDGERAAFLSQVDQLWQELSSGTYEKN